MPVRKTTATKQAEAKQDEVIKEVPEVTETKDEKPTSKQRKQKLQIDRNELVPCRNATDGQLIYKSKKTSEIVTWSDYGDVEFIEVGELLTMKASQPKFLTDVWLVIDDEEVVEYLNLQEVYKNLADIDDIESLFAKSPTELREITVKLPKGLKETVATKARKMIESGDLYDTRKINVLEQTLNIDLKLFME